MMKGNLGRMGETYFNNMCSTVNLTCNGSNEDNTGWDFVVEFPHGFDKAPLADKAPATKEFKVQVKATNDVKRKLAIKMSNLMRLCTTPMPAFIVFIEYNNKPQPEEIYLVHIDKDIIYHVLKRARANSISNTRKNFHNSTLTISYSDKHRLKSLTGEALIDAINTCIPQSMDKYFEEKINLVKNLGYEKSSFQLKFNTKSKSDTDDLVSASLGWVDKIKILDTFGYDTRFEMLVPVEDMNSPEAEISFQVNEGAVKGAITFTNLKTKKRIKQDCELFFSQVAFIAPKGMAKFRVKGNSFDILIGLHGSKSQVKFIKNDTLLSPYDIRDALTLMRWLTFQEDEIELFISPNKKGKEARLTMNADKKITPNDEFRKNLDALDRAIFTIMGISARLGIEQHLKITVNDLRKNESVLSTIAPIIQGDEHPYPFLRFNDSEVSSMGDFEGRLAIGIVFNCTFGEMVFYFITSAEGEVSKSGNHYILSNPKITLEEIKEGLTGENKTSEIIEIINKIGSSYDDKGIGFISTFNP